MGKSQGHCISIEEVDLTSLPLYLLRKYKTLTPIIITELTELDLEHLTAG